jgi:hypothetical protein
MAPAIIRPDRAFAQVGGLMFPGPGMPASSGGGGGTVVIDALVYPKTATSWTHTPVGAATALAVTAYSYGASGVTATCNGTTMPLAVSVTDGGPSVCYIFGLANPGAGPYAIVLSGTIDYPDCSSISVTGSDTTTCFRNTNSASGSSSSGSVTVSSATGDLVLSAMGTQGAGNGTVTGPQTDYMVNNPVGGEVASAGTTAGAATVTPSYSFSGSGPWSLLAASFKHA